MKKIFMTLVLLTMCLQSSDASPINERIIIFDGRICNVQAGGYSCAGEAMDRAGEEKISEIQSELKNSIPTSKKNKFIDLRTKKSSKESKTVIFDKDTVCTVRCYGWYCNHGYLSKKEEIKLEKIRQKLNK